LYLIFVSNYLECETDNKWRPIHYVCRHHTLEMIQYMVGNGVDL